MNRFTAFFESVFAKRLLVFLFFSIFLFIIKDMINIVLLTFILAFLMYRVQLLINKILPRKFTIRAAIMYVVLYILLAAAIVFGLYFAIHKIIIETQSLKDIILSFLGIDINAINSGDVSKLTLNDILPKLGLPQYVADLVANLDLSQYDIGTNISKVFSLTLGYIKVIYEFALQFFLAFLLSLFFLLERKRIMAFGQLFEKSRISGFYRELNAFFKKFINTFGVVIENQVLVSAINTVLSIIGLYILGFTNLVALGAMIFLLGLIPVAGVIISFIPLSIITLATVPEKGFLILSIHGFPRLIAVTIMILFIHSIESYIISPKLLSDKVRIPIFFVFCILLFSEHFFGIWGLIVGIPIFVFIIDLLGVDPKDTIKLED